MSTAIDAAPAEALAVDIPYDLTIDLFARIVETGLIPPGRRVYLRDGRLYEKMAKTKAHGSVGAAVTRAVTRRMPEDWSLWPESTLVLDPANAPLPDFSVVRSSDLIGRAEPERYPGPGDVGLVIELAVTSLKDDLTTSLERYA